MSKNLSRRDFLKNTAAGGLGIASLSVLGACTAAEETATEAVATDVATAAATTAPVVDATVAAEATPVATAEAVAASAEKTWGAILNPQDTSFTNFTTDYSAIFSPLKIGGKTLKNRLVKSAAGSEMQKSSDWPSDTALAYYGEFAKGGVGMICWETSNVIPAAPGAVLGNMGGANGAPGGDSGAGEGPGGDGGGGFGGAMAILDLSTDAGIPAHQAMADYIHGLSPDTVLIAQVYDLMGSTGFGSTFVENTTLEQSFASGVMQTTEAIQAEIQNLVNAAERYYKAGYDGIELNASCNHYFSTYLSRYQNRDRTDQYSAASIENRTRLLCETIQGIRERVGSDFIVQVLYSGVEDNVATLGTNELCTTVDEACEMAKYFEAAGASSLHIRSELFGHHCGGFMPDVMHLMENGYTGYGSSVIDYSQHASGKVLGQYEGTAGLLDVAAKIKSNVSIPVGVVGNMDPRLAPDLLNNAIADGKIDFILMTRALMADPQLPNKLKEGRRDEVAPCNKCMTCFVAPFGVGLPMYCRVNPALTRAFGEDMPEGYDPTPAETAKKVMVIGGGPAGMEAARIAGLRGHSVTLYEQSSALGGKMDFTAFVKGPHERIADYKAYLLRQLELNNVTVVTDKAVDVDFVKSEAPDAVVVAVGGLVSALDVEGSDNAKILSYDDLKAAFDAGEAELPVGEHVVIIGAQFEACDMAVHLLKRGKKVTLLNPGPESDLFMNSTVWVGLMGKPWLRGHGAKLYHNVVLKSITDDGVTFDTNYSTTVTVAFDNIVMGQPFQTNRELYDALQGVASDVYAVGDCYAPGTMANGTARANIVARKIGNVVAAAEGETAEVAGTTYTATATGIGDVTVTITVDGGKIVAATVDTSNETEGVGRGLGPQFGEEILTSGTIDAVAGATLTSTATQKALEDVLAQANL